MFLGHGDQSFGHITYAQTAEDILVCNLFKILGIEKPSYLDLGAHHPFNISNTALLYSLGSRGVNVDANPNLMEEFIKHRPDDLNLCVGVVPDEKIKTAILHCFDSHSGRNSLLDGYLESDINCPLSDQLQIPVKTITINEIVEKFCDNIFPNFLSVDIEGLDCDILASADFETLGYPKVICVESVPYRDPKRLIEIMHLQGYCALIRLADNVIFVQKDNLVKLSQ